MHGSRAWRAAALALVIAIVVFGVIPTREVVHVASEGHDNLVTSAAHFLEYAALAFVLAVALDDWRISRRAVLGAILLAACLGVTIEVVQAPLPYRDAQLSDALLDIAGAALGISVFSAAARARARRPRWRRG
jgi:VanZ family protein